MQDGFSVTGVFIRSSHMIANICEGEAQQLDRLGKMIKRGKTKM